MKFDFNYDETENILTVSFEGFVFRTVEDVKEFIEAKEKICKSLGKKCYFLIDYRRACFGPEIDYKTLNFLGREIKRMMDQYALGVVRFGGALLDYLIIEKEGLLHHFDSNFYKTREGALNALKRMKKEDEKNNSDLYKGNRTDEG
jgi:hypothetical protein